MDDQALRAFLQGKITLSGVTIEITDERVVIRVPNLGTTQEASLINLTHRELGELVGLLGGRAFLIGTAVPSTIRSSS